MDGMNPAWMGALSPEDRERLLATMRPVVEKLVELMPRIEEIVEKYVDKGTELAEKHANEGDE
jgi:hypothetical protein